MTSEPTSYLRSNRLGRKMTSNTPIKGSLLNTPPFFNSCEFELWQAMFVIFIQSINHELWKTIINVLFISTYQVNGEVVNKLGYLWTKEEKRIFEIDFKTKSFIVTSLYDSIFFNVHDCKTAKEIWDTLEMIYGASPSIEHEEINRRGEEVEDTTFKPFSNLKMLEIILERLSLTNV